MSEKTKALKNKVIDVASDVISAPTRAYYGAKSKIANEKYKQTVGMRNFKNRTTDTNKYKSTSYWANNKD